MLCAHSQTDWAKGRQWKWASERENMRHETERAAELQEEESRVGWKAEPQVVSQPTFERSPVGLTEPMTINSQSVRLLPSLSLQGKPPWFVVLAFEIMTGRRSIQRQRLDDKQVMEVFMFISLTHSIYSIIPLIHMCTWCTVQMIPLINSKQDISSHSQTAHIVGVYFSQEKQKKKKKQQHCRAILKKKTVCCLIYSAYMLSFLDSQQNRFSLLISIIITPHWINNSYTKMTHLVAVVSFCTHLLSLLKQIQLILSFTTAMKHTLSAVMAFRGY